MGTPHGCTPVGTFWVSKELRTMVVPYLNPRHSRLLNQEGDEDEASQALSPRQRDDGVQVPAGATSGAGECVGVKRALAQDFPAHPRSPWSKTLLATEPLICTPNIDELAQSKRGEGLLWF